MERHRRSDEEWRELIRQCKASGLSDHEWLKQNHISESSFYNKLKKFSNQGVEESTPVSKKNLREVPESHDIVQISFEDGSNSLQTSSIPKTAAITLHAASFTLDIHNHAEAEVIRNTLLALKSLC